MMKKFELVFIPSPGLSHLISTVEAAKLLLHRDGRLYVTVLIMKAPNNASVDRYTQQTSADPNTSPRLNLLHLPALHRRQNVTTQSSLAAIYDLIENQTDNVREAVSNLIQRPGSDLAGLVLDMFCTRFMEIGREFGLHSYVFFTSGAAGLALSEHMVEMRLEQKREINQYKHSDVDFPVPYFKSPVPYKALPAVARVEDPAADGFLSLFRRINEAKGVMVNTFYELESFAIDALNSDGKIPRVYPVGPVLSQSGQTFGEDNDDVEKWLDDQPENSVVFLCFGSLGSLDEAQVREFSLALENSGCQFLWSLRKRGAEGMRSVAEYEDVNEVLPEGFLERTKGVGKVIGWAPQVAVLAHVAIGGFVSHCGWNSILESMWFGVAIAGFPMYAEQHMNAFYLATELGMAEMISLEYEIESRGEEGRVVGWKEIAAAIGRLMTEGSGVRVKVKEMKKKARLALEEGGSSYKAQSLFIEDVIRNVA